MEGAGIVPGTMIAGAGVTLGRSGARDAGRVTGLGTGLDACDVAWTVVPPTVICVLLDTEVGETLLLETTVIFPACARAVVLLALPVLAVTDTAEPL